MQFGQGRMQMGQSPLGVRNPFAASFNPNQTLPYRPAPQQPDMSYQPGPATQPPIQPMQMPPIPQPASPDAGSVSAFPSGMPDPSIMPPQMNMQQQNNGGGMYPMLRQSFLPI